jgi:CubicO group peptidase (beta-lactamase class C family)
MTALVMLAIGAAVARLWFAQDDGNSSCPAVFYCLRFPSQKRPASSRHAIPSGEEITMRPSRATLAVAASTLLSFAFVSHAFSQATPPKFPSAEESDPVKLGWMVGSPPPPEKLVRFGDASMYRFPQLRWSYSNIRQLMPTTGVSRGSGNASTLSLAERDDIDAIAFTPLGRSEAMTWKDSLGANYTDGIVVLHKGRIVYERYFGALRPEGQHIAMSVTKSFFGTIAAMLVAEGKLNEGATASSYVPELKDTAFGEATIRQLLDMTTGIQYSENYADPKAEIYDHIRAGNMIPRPPGYAGPNTFYDFLVTLKKEGEHGQGFAYKTVNTDALGWIIRRVTGKSVSENLSERIWSKIGAEQDAYFTVDLVGNEFAGGGLNAALRDFARFGEMIRMGGSYNGQQIIPKSVIEDIRKGASKEDFAKANYKLLPGWSYRNMWWVTHNEHGAFMARGVHGQAIYIDPQAEMVIARFGSHPLASNAFNDPTSLPAYHALAKHLIANPR